MTYHWQASLGAIIVATLISASRTGATANYDIDNLPATDRLAAASGLALTNTSHGLADVRVCADEDGH
jgi:hypothetical protein